MLELQTYVIFGLLTLISVLIAWRLMYAFKHFKIKQMISEPGMLKDLPSLSVCIPARNETHAMTQCLERVIASTYPKLEIIVLDDSSVDDTSMLIKAFAHAGVRFVEGSRLPEGWLGKNHALQGLLNEASGKIILFMDVDTHIQPDTIGQLVSYMGQEKADMISVLPMRRDGLRTSVHLGTLRYFWELIFHRRNAPAVSSGAWMIKRKSLQTEFNGFKTLKTAVQPEKVLAAVFMKTNRYRFLIGTTMLGVGYEKKWQSQVETSVRLLFPTFGGHLEAVFFAFLGLALLNTPLVIIICSLVNGWTIVESMALWQLCIYSALYGLYLEKVWAKGWWIGMLLWPVIIAQELVLLIMSTIGYMRRSITWKGRPISIKPNLH